MGVRLNKVLTELQIGLQQAVDFLKARKRELGDIKDDASPNTKITDIQYDALTRAFGQGKNYRQKLIFPQNTTQKIRCTRRDPLGKECGHMNDYNNTYCVKCGRVLEGKKKVEIIISETMNALEQRNNSLIEKNEKIQKQNKIYERQIQDLKHEYEKTIRYLTEENRQLLSLIEDEEKEIQRLKEGQGYNSIFVGGPKYDLVLKYVGAAKLQVVKAVKEAFNLGLKEAKDLVDGAPSILKRGVSMGEAERLKKYIEAAGATVEIK